MNKKRMNENEWWQQACLVNKNDVKNSSRKNILRLFKFGPAFLSLSLFPILFYFFFSDRKRRHFWSQSETEQRGILFLFRGSFDGHKKGHSVKISIKNNLALIFSFFK